MPPPYLLLQVCVPLFPGLRVLHVASLWWRLPLCVLSCQLEDVAYKRLSDIGRGSYVMSDLQVSAANFNHSLRVWQLQPQPACSVSDMRVCWTTQLCNSSLMLVVQSTKTARPLKYIHADVSIALSVWCCHVLPACCTTDVLTFLSPYVICNAMSCLRCIPLKPAGVGDVGFAGCCASL